MAGITLPLDAPATAYPMASTPTAPQADILGGLGRFSRAVGGAAVSAATAPVAIARQFVAPALSQYLTGLTGNAPVAIAAPAAAPAPAATIAPAIKASTTPTGAGVAATHAPTPAAAPAAAHNLYHGKTLDQALAIQQLLNGSVQTALLPQQQVTGDLRSLALKDFTDAANLPAGTPQEQQFRDANLLAARARLEKLGETYAPGGYQNYALGNVIAQQQQPQVPAQ